MGLRLRLPDAAGWKVDDRTGPWFSAVHAASRSTLAVRVWRPSALGSPAACEKEARAERTLPARGAAELLEDGPLDVPPGLGTRVAVGLDAGKPGTLRGFVLAFGGWAHRCFAYAYETEVVGGRAAEAAAARLAAMRQGSLGRLQLESSLALPEHTEVAPPLGR